MSTYKERVDFIYRDLLKVYYDNKIDRRIKLSEETDRKIRKIAMEELKKLHEEKWTYKKEYQEVQSEVQSQLRQELESIRAELVDSNKSEMEKAELRLAYQEKKLELEQNIELLPEYLAYNKQQQQDIINKVRKDIAKSYRKPIKITDRVVNKVSQWAIKQASRILAIANGKKADNVSSISEIAPMDVSTINSKSISKDIDNLFNSAEQENVPVQVSNFVDSNMSSLENNASVLSGENSLPAQADENKEVETFESMMGIGDNKDNMEKGNVNENASKLSSNVNIVDDIEVNIPVDTTDSDVNYDNSSEQLGAYENKLADLMREMENEEDIIKLSSMREKMLKIKEDKNLLVEQIRREEQRKIDEIKQAEQELLQQESAKKQEARKCLVSEMRTLGESVSDDLDNAKTSIQTSMEETAATISNITNNMEEVKKSIAMYESFITPPTESSSLTTSSSSELENMINESNYMEQPVDVGTKRM